MVAFPRTMDDGLTLNEIELQLFLLKKKTTSAIERNEAYISRLEQKNRQRDELIASLQGLSVLDDESLYRPETSSLSASHSTCSEHSASRSSFDPSFDESRDDKEIDDHSTGSMEWKRHGIVEGASGLSDSTSSSRSSKKEAIQQLENEREKKINTMLNDLIISLERDEKAVAERHAQRHFVMKKDDSL
jgi:hypothetical protein